MKPDIEVFPGEVTIKKNEFAIKEADLKKHLENELTKINGDTIKHDEDNLTKDANGTVVDDTIITEQQLYKDAQLKSAVDILKALIITNKGK